MKPWTILLLFLICACNQAVKQEPHLKQEQTIDLDQDRSAMVIESISYDLNSDGEADKIMLKNPPVEGDPGEFETIEIELSNGMTFKHSFREVWDSIAEYAVEGLSNTLKSDRVFCLKQNGQNFLFLFGFQYGCCTRQLTIITIADDKPKQIFDQEFELSQIIDLDGDGTLDIIGRGNHIELYSEADSLHAYIGTYSPFKIFSLSSKATLREGLSKKYNEEHYVYAGLESSANIEIAYPKKDFDFKPFIIGDSISNYGKTL